MFFLAATRWAGAMHRKAHRLALAEAPILFFCVMLCWQNVKICECLLGMPSFQCIGGGSVPPPISCQTLGWAMRRKASPGLGGGAANPFFCVVLCWQNVKICECLLGMPSFQCIGGGSVPPPISCQTLGRAMRRKARRLALAEAPILFFVSYRVGKTLKSVNVCLKYPVFNALGAAVCRPQSVAGRWAGRCAKRRVAWPWRRRQCICLLCRMPGVGKMLKSVSVFFKCPVFNAWGRKWLPAPIE